MANRDSSLEPAAVVSAKRGHVRDINKMRLHIRWENIEELNDCQRRITGTVV